MKTLYITDLDGTLLNSDGKISEFSEKTINSLIKKGMNFTFATARSIASASGIVDGIDLKLPAVMMNGVFLTDIKQKKQCSVCKIPKEIAKKVIAIFESHGRPPFVYNFNGEYIETEYKTIKSQYEQQFVDKRKSLYRKFDVVENYTAKGDTVYINGIDSKEIIEAVVNDIKKIDGVKYSYYLDIYSGNKYFLEVFYKTAGKWNCIKKLKELYGFDRVVAFGDNGNDVEMLENVDLGIAVGNAQPIAKQVAELIIGDNNSDGVAKYLLDLYEKGVL